MASYLAMAAQLEEYTAATINMKLDESDTAENTNSELRAVMPTSSDKD